MKGLRCWLAAHPLLRAGAATLLLTGAAVAMGFAPGESLGYAALLAALMGMASAWELRLLGDPHDPAEWPGQAAFVLALTCLFSHTLGVQEALLPVYEPSSFGWLGDVAAHGVRRTLDLLPDAVLSFFANWRIGLSVLLFLCAMCVRAPRFRSAALAVLVAAPLAVTLAQGGSPRLVCGAGLFVAGLAFQLRPAGRLHAFQAGCRQLAPLVPVEPAFVCAALQVLWRLRCGAPVPFQTIEASGPDAKAMEDAVRRMVALGLVETRETAAARTVRLATSLRRPSPLAALARFPRAVFLLLIALVWAMLPIDLIPDGLPFFGLLDDLAVSMLALRAFKGEPAPPSVG